MKKLAPRRSPSSTSTNRRFRILAVLGSIVLAAGTFVCGSGAQSDLVTELRAKLQQKDDDLTKCADDKVTDKDNIDALKRKLANVEASHKKLNDWKNFLRGSKAKVKGETFDETQLRECRDIKAETAKVAAWDMIDSLGITDEADQQALIDSYKKGCYVNHVGDGKIFMSQKDEPYCGEELEVDVENNFVDPRMFSGSSAAEKEVLEHFKNKNYDSAVDAYSTVIAEAEAYASGVPEIRELPFYNEFKKNFKDVYDDMKSDNALDGMCRIFMLIDKYKGYENNAELDALFNGDTKEDFMVVMRKMMIMMEILEKLVERDHPQFGDDIYNSKITAECIDRGFSMSMPPDYSADVPD